MRQTIIDLLSTPEFGGDFTKSNVRSGNRAIPTWENEMLQVRDTRAQNGQPPGVRVSLRGEALGDLARKDNGFAKLEFHLKLRDTLTAGLSDGLTVSFNDQPRGQGSGYPIIYVNRATTQAVDPSEYVAEAKAAGVPDEKVLACIFASDYTQLRALTAFHTATTGSEDAPAVEDTDSDGDALPF